MPTLQRVQVLIDVNQRQTLRKIARREKRSMSAVLRDIIDQGLAKRTADQQQWKQALADLQELREANPSYHGNVADLLNEVRSEREEQMEKVWRGSS